MNWEKCYLQKVPLWCTKLSLTVDFKGSHDDHDDDDDDDDYDHDDDVEDDHCASLSST